VKLCFVYTLHFLDQEFYIYNSLSPLFLCSTHYLLFDSCHTPHQAKLVDALTNMLSNWCRVDWDAHYTGDPASEDDADSVLIFCKLDSTVHYYAEIQLLLEYLTRLYTLVWQIDTDDMLVQNSILHFCTLVCSLS